MKKYKITYYLTNGEKVEMDIETHAIGETFRTDLSNTFTHHNKAQVVINNTHIVKIVYWEIKE